MTSLLYMVTSLGRFVETTLHTTCTLAYVKLYYEHVNMSLILYNTIVIVSL